MTGLILTIVGARPNFMKAAPIHDAFREPNAGSFRHEIVHTGQHYDDAMSKVFFDDLGMPKPIVYLGVGSASHAVQTAQVMIGLEKVFLEMKPAAVNVVGDVNSTLAAALVASKLRIPVAHTEAGLRSRDWDMPEEVNRCVTDVVSSLLLTPSADADENLRAEGRDPSAIVRVGNVMIDTLKRHLDHARSLHVAGRYGLVQGRYAVVTLHRPSNVDVPGTLEGLLGTLLEIASELPVIFPVHPRTQARLGSSGVGAKLTQHPNIRVIDPLGYLDFLSLTSEAKLILTDSGGLQEESTALGLPCLTLRENTERPITVTEGTNTVVGSNPAAILSAFRDIMENGGKAGRIPELWDGHTGARIRDAIVRHVQQRTSVSDR